MLFEKPGPPMHECIRRALDELKQNNNPTACISYVTHVLTYSNAQRYIPVNYSKVIGAGANVGRGAGESGETPYSGGLAPMMGGTPGGAAKTVATAAPQPPPHQSASSSSSPATAAAVATGKVVLSTSTSTASLTNVGTSSSTATAADKAGVVVGVVGAGRDGAGPAVRRDKEGRSYVLNSVQVLRLLFIRAEAFSIVKRHDKACIDCVAAIELSKGQSPEAYFYYGREQRKLFHIIGSLSAFESGDALLGAIRRAAAADCVVLKRRSRSERAADADHRSVKGSAAVSLATSPTAAPAALRAFPHHADPASAAALGGTRGSEYAVVYDPNNTHYMDNSNFIAALHGDTTDNFNLVPSSLFSNGNGGNSNGNGGGSGSSAAHDGHVCGSDEDFWAQRGFQLADVSRVLRVSRRDFELLERLGRTTSTDPMVLSEAAAAAVEWQQLHGGPDTGRALTSNRTSLANLATGGGDAGDHPSIPASPTAGGGGGPSPFEAAATAATAAGGSGSNASGTMMSGSRGVLSDFNLLGVTPAELGMWDRHCRESRALSAMRTSHTISLGLLKTSLALLSRKNGVTKGGTLVTLENAATTAVRLLGCHGADAQFNASFTFADVVEPRMAGLAMLQPRRQNVLWGSSYTACACYRVDANAALLVFAESPMISSLKVGVRFVRGRDADLAAAFSEVTGAPDYGGIAGGAPGEAPGGKPRYSSAAAREAALRAIAVPPSGQWLTRHRMVIGVAAGEGGARAAAPRQLHAIASVAESTNALTVTLVESLPERLRSVELLSVLEYGGKPLIKKFGAVNRRLRDLVSHLPAPLMYHAAAAPALSRYAQAAQNYQNSLRLEEDAGGNLVSATAGGSEGAMSAEAAFASTAMAMAGGTGSISGSAVTADGASVSAPARGVVNPACLSNGYLFLPATDRRAYPDYCCAADRWTSPFRVYDRERVAWRLESDGRTVDSDEFVVTTAANSAGGGAGAAGGDNSTVSSSRGGGGSHQQQQQQQERAQVVFAISADTQQRNTGTVYLGDKKCPMYVIKDSWVPFVNPTLYVNTISNSGTATAGGGPTAAATNRTIAAVRILNNNGGNSGGGGAGGAGGGGSANGPGAGAAYTLCVGPSDPAAPGFKQGKVTEEVFYTARRYVPKAVRGSPAPNSAALMDSLFGGATSAAAAVSSGTVVAAPGAAAARPARPSDALCEYYSVWRPQTASGANLDLGGGGGAGGGGSSASAGAAAARVQAHSPPLPGGAVGGGNHNKGEEMIAEIKVPVMAPLVKGNTIAEIAMMRGADGLLVSLLAFIIARS